MLNKSNDGFCSRKEDASALPAELRNKEIPSPRIGRYLEYNVKKSYLKSLLVFQNKIVD